MTLEQFTNGLYVLPLCVVAGVVLTAVLFYFWKDWSDSV